MFLLYLTRDDKASDERNGERHLPPLAHRSEVLGAFYEYVYCAQCGDLHRHDLLGQACRKCGDVVGPRANVRVEKYWRPPHFRGPADAPIKEIIHDVHRQKRRR